MRDTLKRILYIDDDDDILAIAKLALEKIGKFNVTTCSKGTEGIKLARKDPPDLIMMDVMMPGIDGPGILHVLRNDVYLCNVPVIFMTAKVQPKEIEKYLSLGAMGIIPKPFNPITLSDEIQSFWKSRSSSEIAAFPDFLKDLRKQFLLHLRHKHKDICTLLARYKKGSLTAQERESMLYIVHNLGGQGLSYGYPQITHTARALERALEKSKLPANFVALTTRLLATITLATAPQKRKTSKATGA